MSLEHHTLQKQGDQCGWMVRKGDRGGVEGPSGGTLQGRRLDFNWSRKEARRCSEWGQDITPVPGTTLSATEEMWVSGMVLGSDGS